MIKDENSFGLRSKNAIIEICFISQISSKAWFKKLSRLNSERFENSRSLWKWKVSKGFNWNFQLTHYFRVEKVAAKRGWFRWPWQVVECGHVGGLARVCVVGAGAVSGAQKGARIKNAWRLCVWVLARSRALGSHSGAHCQRGPGETRFHFFFFRALERGDVRPERLCARESPSPSYSETRLCFKRILEIWSSEKRAQPYPDA